MQPIVTLAPNTMALVALYEAASRADAEGRQFHLVTGQSNETGAWFKFKVGEGVWSAPISAIPYNMRHAVEPFSREDIERYN